MRRLPAPKRPSSWRTWAGSNRRGGMPHDDEKGLRFAALFRGVGAKMAIEVADSNEAFVDVGRHGRRNHSHLIEKDERLL